MSYINEIKTKNGTTYDVQDKRLTVTSADAGKVVSVDSNGNLVLTTPSGGTQLYKHRINDGSENYTIDIITPSSTPIDFTSITSLQLLYNYLQSLPFYIIFNGGQYEQIVYFNTSGSYKLIYPDYYDSSSNTMKYYSVDDFACSGAVDTVTPL